MTYRFRIYAVLMAGVLALLAGQPAEADDVAGGLLQELKKQIVQAIPREFVQEIKQQFAQEIKKQLVAEVKRELIDNVRPQAISAGMSQMSRLQTDDKNSEIGSVVAAVGKLLQTKEYPRTQNLDQSTPPESTPAHRTLRAGLVAVVTNASNPVRTLTVDQVKRLFTGEYTNWNQVGGPDLEVKVVVWSGNTVELEDLMKASIARDGLTLRYASFLIPAVDRAKGAIGFLTTRNVEQVEFVTRHEAIQKIAIRADEHSPAVNPGVGAIRSGSYPMMVGQTTKSMHPGNPSHASARVSLGLR